MEAPHPMANRCHHPHLPLHLPQFREVIRPREPRAPGKPIQQIILPRNMDNYSAGRRVLDCHEDTQKVA